MSFWGRVLGVDLPRIPIHQLCAAMGELERGKVTQQDVVDFFQIAAGAETTDAVALLAKMIPPEQPISVGSGPVTFTNVGATYDSNASGLGLGSVLVQTAGITRVIFGVRVNKVGSGTQSWQLWNETDGTEVAVVDDAGATGVKNLPAVTANFAPALAAGMKLCRVRVKSTVAADDPIFYGAALSIRRASSLTALELHEVLMLAEPASSPYHSESAIRTRLGL